MPETCRHCGRGIVFEEGAWIDPEATGDDEVWREACGSHDTFTAEHEPEAQRGDLAVSSKDGSTATYLGPNLDDPDTSVIENEAGDLFLWSNDSFTVEPQDARYDDDPESLTDAQALDRLNYMLSAEEWSVSFLEDACEIVRATGRTEIEGAEWASH